MNEKKKTSKLIIPIMFTLAFCLGFYISTYQFNLVKEADAFSLTNSQVGFLGGIIMGVQCFIPVIFGILADKKGKKLYLCLAMVLLILGVVCFYNANGFGLLVLGAFLAGSGYGSLEGLHVSVLADAYPHLANRLVNWAQMALAIGTTVGPLAAAGLINIGFTWRFLFIPPLVVFVIALILTILIDIRPREDIKAVVEMQTETEKEVPAEDEKRSLSDVFKSPMFYMLMLWIMLCLGIENSIASYSEMYFERYLGTNDYSGMALSIFWFMYIPSRFIFGLRKSSDSLKPVTICGMAIVVAAIIISLTKSPIVVLVCLGVCGFSLAPIWPGIYDQAQRAFPYASGTVGTIQVACAGLGAFIFTTLFGIISDGEGASLSFVFVGIAVISLFCVLFSILSDRYSKKHYENQ